MGCTREPASEPITGACSPHHRREAHRFLFTQPGSFYSPKGEMLVTWDELGEDMRRGGKFLFALAPWVKKLKRNASPEQLQFLDDINLGDKSTDADDEEACAIAPSPAREQTPEEPLTDREAWAASTTIPEPAHAVRSSKACCRATTT